MRPRFRRREDDADPAQLNRCRPHQERAARVVTGGASPAIEDDVGDHEEDAIDAHLVKTNDRIKQKVGQRDQIPQRIRKAFLVARSTSSDTACLVCSCVLSKRYHEGWVSTGLRDCSVNIRVQKNHHDLRAG